MEKPDQKKSKQKKTKQNKIKKRSKIYYGNGSYKGLRRNKTRILSRLEQPCRAILVWIDKCGKIALKTSNRIGQDLSRPQHQKVLLLVCHGHLYR